jgi:hypothetical protein
MPLDKKASLAIMHICAKQKEVACETKKDAVDQMYARRTVFPAAVQARK